MGDSTHLTRCTACTSINLAKIMDVKDHFKSGEIFTIHECKSCGFRFTQDAPDEDVAYQYYESDDYISHSDTKKGIVSQLYHKVREIMLRRKSQLILSLSTGKRLLDIGSGTGYFLNYMKHKGYDVKGVEISNTARQFSIDHFGLDVVSPDILFSQSFSETYDFITLWHVLEHLYNPDRYMQKISDLLVDDGHLIIALPNHQSYDQNKYKSYWAAYDVPRHLWHFHPNSLTTFASRHGFEVIKMQDMPFDPFYNAMLSEKYIGHRAGLILGAFTGLISMFKGKSNIRKAASVIYILKKIQVTH